MKSTLTPHQKLVATIAAAYPTPTWEPPTLRLWDRLLSDIELDVLSVVVDAWIKTKGRPEIKDIRRAAAEEKARVAGTPYLSADDAWGFVQRCILQLGANNDFPAKYELVRRTVERIGWRALCHSDNQIADRAHFLQLYRQLRESALDHAAGTPGAAPVLPVDRLAPPPRRRELPAPEEDTSEPVDVRALLSGTIRKIQGRQLEDDLAREER